MKDALNKEVVIGGMYGYLQNNNGITSVRIGIVTAESTMGLAVLKIEEAKSAYRNAELKKEKITREIIAVKSNMLFPLGIEKFRIEEVLLKREKLLKMASEDISFYMLTPFAEVLKARKETAAKILEGVNSESETETLCCMLNHYQQIIINKLNL